MIPRRVIVALLWPAPVLIVTFAVLMGGSALAAATDDQIAASVLKWVAIAALLVLAVDLILLLLALGLRAAEHGGNDDQRPS